MADFSHLTARGEAAMVNLGDKKSTSRRAVVSGGVVISALCLEKLTDAAALEIARTARIAGIQGAKQTSTLVPMCHPIFLTGVDIDITLNRDAGRFDVQASASTESATGVEMEALTAAAVAGITIYDMIKAVDPAAVVGPFTLLEKTGGKSGHWARPT